MIPDCQFCPTLVSQGASPMTDQEEPSTPDLTNSVREQRCEADVAREQDQAPA